MTITITAFERSPDGGKGLARDTRVRWALEEVGQPYDVRLVSFSEMKEPAHRKLHPFGQIPTYEEGDLTLFELGERGDVTFGHDPLLVRHRRREGRDPAERFGAGDRRLQFRAQRTARRPRERVALPCDPRRQEALLDLGRGLGLFAALCPGECIRVAVGERDCGGCLAGELRERRVGVQHDGIALGRGAALLVVSLVVAWMLGRVSMPRLRSR